MSQTSTLPETPLSAEAASAPEAPQATSPENTFPASPQGQPAPMLSTSSLTAAIAAQLRGTPVQSQSPAEAPGTELSPEAAADPGSTEDDDQPTPAEHSMPPNAVAAMAQGRKQRRELKQELKAKDNLIVQLQETLSKLDGRLASLEGNGSKASNGTNGSHAPEPQTPTGPVSPELAAAEKAEADARDMSRWSATKLRELARANASGEDTEPLLATLRTELQAHQVTLPPTADAVQTWLESLQANAEEQLADLRVNTRVLRREVVQSHTALRAESEALRDQWVPEAKDASTPRGQKLKAIREQFPQMESHPMGPRFMAAAIRGWEIVEAELNAKGKPPAAPARAGANGAPQRPTPRLPGASSALPPRPSDAPASPSTFVNRMASARTEAELRSAKADWEKSLAGNLVLH